MTEENNTNTTVSNDRLERAKKRVAELKEFYNNLVTYVSVNIVLIIIDMMFTDGMWFYWVTLFWGLAIIWKAVHLFWGDRFLTKEWEQKKVKEYMDKDDF